MTNLNVINYHFRVGQVTTIALATIIALEINSVYYSFTILQLITLSTLGKINFLHDNK